MISCRHVAAATLVVLLLSFTVTAQFKLEIVVVEFSDSSNSCGADGCDLFINRLCLGPSNEECTNGACSLDEDSSDLDLENDLPKTATLTSSQPWPVDYRLFVDIKDSDFGTDDDIDEIVICRSLLANSGFTTEMEFSGNRVTLTLKFRVQCTDNYEGPRCDCLPQDDDVNGHYRCEADGSVSCLPGYRDPSSFCRQDHCTGVECQPNTTCVNGDDTYTCECLEGADCNTPTVSPPPTNASPPPTTASSTTTSTTDSELTNGTVDECNCENQGSCIEEDGVYSCICTEGFTGEKCSTPAPSNSGPSPRPQNREGPGGMSTAAIAGTVAGIVLAVLICCVVLAVVVVCVRLRRRRRTQMNSKQSPEGSSVIVKVPISPSGQSGMVENPMYSDVVNNGVAATDDKGELASSTSTLRRMSNPLYGDTDNPLYEEHADKGVYSVPRRHPQTSSSTAGEGEGEGGGGGWIYSDPDSPPPRSVGADGDESGVYAYAAVGGRSGDSTVVHDNTITAAEYDTLTHKTEPGTTHNEYAYCTQNTDK